MDQELMICLQLCISGTLMLDLGRASFPSGQTSPSTFIEEIIQNWCTDGVSLMANLVPWKAKVLSPIYFQQPHFHLKLQGSYFFPAQRQRGFGQIWKQLWRQEPFPKIIQTLCKAQTLWWQKLTVMFSNRFRSHLLPGLSGCFSVSSSKTAHLSLDPSSREPGLSSLPRWVTSHLP